MTPDYHWEPFHPAQLREVLEQFECPWWIAGGWALELFAGWRIRAHDDLDVELPRNCLEDAAACLPGWDLQTAHAGRLERWEPGTALPEHVDSLWCRPDEKAPWRFQIMLTTIVDGRWFYRRDRRVSRAVDTIGIEGAGYLPILAPEIQLLYKSRTPRAKDQLDFDVTVELLDDLRRAWLIDALELTSPGHVWLATLRA